MEAMPSKERTWVVAEFGDGPALLQAALAMRERGYADVDTHSPYPLHGGEAALGLRRSRVPLIAGAGALAGLLTGYGLQVFSNAIDWAINVGGRPPHSPPTNVPITFELTVLACAFSIFFGLLLLMRLPQPYHPVFESESFRSATTHGFWISVPAG
jgi:hypothetical protein